MSNGLTRIEINNFRSIANLNLELNSLNVLFGPNGVGKSSFLDVLLFLSQGLNKSVNEVAAERGHGLGLLWDGADPTDNIVIELESTLASYQITIGFSQGRTDAECGESFISKSKGQLIKRALGEQDAVFYAGTEGNITRHFSLTRGALLLAKYTDVFPPAKETFEMKGLLESVSFHLAREDNIERLRRLGSESSHLLKLSDKSENLWSVLRNLRDRSVLDTRYEIVSGFMRESFPTFRELLFEQTGNLSVYTFMIEKERRQPIPASGMSDGHLQMLINLTALFSEEKGKTSLILFDEPETSLHPHAIAKFAEAVKLATQEWGRQVFIATHSPVLLSQFEPENILAVGMGERGETEVQRVSEIEEVKDLLEDYALGSLYMAEAIAPQSKHLTQVGKE